MSIVGPAEARPADGLAVDFVVESDRAQLSEIVQRVRDGRLRTNIGTVSTLDDAVAAFNPTERMQREDDHPRSSVSDARLSTSTNQRNHHDQRHHQVIVSRSTTKYYDPAVTLSDDQIRELVQIGTTAPTSFHLQNWRFIAVRTPEAKARLRPIAWDQPAITEAAVTFIVCLPLAIPA